MKCRGAGASRGRGRRSVVAPRRASGRPPPARQSGSSGQVAASRWGGAAASVPAGAVLALPGGRVAAGGGVARMVLLWPPLAMALGLRDLARSELVGLDLGLAGPVRYSLLP